MSPNSPLAALREWITQRLDPLTDQNFDSGLVESDFGPQSADLAAGPPLAPAAVLVGLVEREHGYSVLLTRRADTLRRHTGQIAFPGGRRDPGETIWETALRETEEEVGIPRSLVTLGGLSTPYRTGTGFLVTPVVGFIAPHFTLSPNPAEVADVFETPFGFLMDPSNHEEHEREFSGQLRRFYAMTHENRFIWGATAGMLRSLYDRLYGGAVA
ncbi:MAG: CoA pyrophosphatase [Phenylobacterium sp.]|uniref:CoA pyrophosphatase n=1 Tax=Phenylobacterium sp. TaxID=1871053 RepID=UPI00271F4749|nr:CoA pyrophosphatase [Phenylobacterium sp.]MDO8902655.1 CoA pyrophosphatase [Phenylobacterium sp.]MDP2214393.1 CoA pyrophosphatase [Phenylobacterium sp.]